MGHVAITDQDASRADALEPRDGPQHGGLAAARRTYENHELPVLDLKIDSVDGNDRTESLRDVFQDQARHRQPFTAPIVMPLMK